MATPATALQGTSGRSVGEAISYAVGHRVRIEVLAALHEGPASTAELARIVHQPLSNMGHHIEELLASGSIEVSGRRQAGNVTQNVYCMVELPEYISEEFAAMSDDEKQATLGLVLQASMAEALASLWAGKLVEDPQVMLAWNRVNLDDQGRADSPRSRIALGCVSGRSRQSRRTAAPSRAIPGLRTSLPVSVIDGAAPKPPRRSKPRSIDDPESSFEKSVWIMAFQYGTVHHLTDTTAPI